MTSPDPSWLTAAEAAESAGVDERTFRRWAVEPVATVGGVRYYSVRAILDNRLEAEQRRRPPAATSAAELRRQVDDAEIMLMRHQAERVELANSERRGELVEVERLAQTIGAAGSAVGAVLDSLPGRVRRIVTMSHTDVERVRRVVVEHQNAISAIELLQAIESSTHDTTTNTDTE